MRIKGKLTEKGMGAAVCMAAAILAAGAALTGCGEGDNGQAVSSPVVLGEYQGILIDPIEVTDEDVEQEIHRMLEAQASVSEVRNRPAAMGDVVDIDYVGRQGGEAFENGSYQDQLLELGSGAFIPSFEEQIAGMLPGETRFIQVTFPEDYWDGTMAGGEAEFEVTLNYIRELSDIPEYTDALAAEITDGELTTAQEYTDWLRGQMELEALSYRRYQLMEAVMAVCQVNTIPEERLDMLTEELENYYTAVAREQYGQSLEEYAQGVGMTLSEFESELALQAQSNAAQDIVTLAIAEKENIQLTDEECEARANQYRYEGFAGMAELYGEERARELLLMDKVRDVLLGE